MKIIIRKQVHNGPYGKKLIVSFKHGWVSEVFILCKDTKKQQQMQERIAFSACAAILF